MNESKMTNENNHETGLEVAVIGMAGRFPGARGLDELWNNLKYGIETVTFFSDKELEAEGQEPELLADPNFVKARGLLEDIEYFDAPFFGYTPSEAELMNPQVRLFLESAWHALEDAGYIPSSTGALIGVYAGAKGDFTWPLKAMTAPNDGSVDAMTAGLLSTKEHLSTRVSYTLDLKGPSYTFYTACSTSLVAIHLGTQAVLSGECDMALAGGVTLHHPQKRGYLYREEMIQSADGHTHSFDSEATGLVDASGVGVVVLKPLEDARRDGDHIYALIKGSAINNDGSRKIGYTAPSITGQEYLMREVYRLAEVETESIGFVECHGSATPLGDPVEVEALRRAFHKTRGNHIAIGSIKSNFGHCDCAAGAASFIKTVLALYHRRIPPSLHFRAPNPKIDFENSPFYVNTRLEEWKNNGRPRRAGVNSLGLGGTNAHVVLEEWPENHSSNKQGMAHGAKPGGESLGSPGDDRRYQLLLLSAKTPEALDRMTKNLADHFKKNPGICLADAAYTLQTGRETFDYRRAFACSGPQDAVKQLSNPESAPVQPFLAGEKERPLVFMYSGQGAQYINMGRDLYQNEETFRKDMDDSFDYLASIINEDIRYILYPQSQEQMKEAEKKIHTFYYTQPLKFIFEYAYSRLLMRWGLVPHALIGYSFGEYMVACMAGVFSLEDALQVLMKRGNIMEKAPAGAMVSVALPEARLKPMLTPGLYIGGVNTEELCLVSGHLDAVEAFEKELEKKNIDFIRYRAACGGHSPLMEPILDELGKELEKITFNKPEIPYVCGLTGTWITDEDAAAPSYFTRQLRAPVRFADALKTLFKTPNSIFLEVGPGTTLVNFVKYYIEKGLQPDVHALTMVRHHKDPVSDDSFLLNRVGQLWSYGRKIDFNAFYENQDRRRISLPPYPFEKHYYWIDFDPIEAAARGLMAVRGGKKTNLKDWFYVPSWRTTMVSMNVPDPEHLNEPRLVFMDAENRGSALVNELRRDGHTVITVHPGDSFEKAADNRYRLNPRQDSDYRELFKQLEKTGGLPSTIIHLGNLSHKNPGQSRAQWNEAVQDSGYYSLLSIARAIGRHGISRDIQMEVVTNGMQSVAGEPLDYPEKAAVLGPVKIIPQEYPNIKCRTMDVVLPEPGSPAENLLMRQLKQEFLTPQTREQVIAFRGDQRLVQVFEPVPLEPAKNTIPRFKEKGVYLIVGGLGGVGLILAHYLAETKKARLILTSRKGLPPRDQWTGYLEKNKSNGHRIALRMQKILEMEKKGGEVLVISVDVSDETAMTKAITAAREQFGPINGVIHCGYVADGTVIDQRTREVSEQVFAPKIKGTMVLDRIFAELEPLDFFVICSSLAGIFGPVGQVAYTAGNAFEDAFARYRRNRTHPSTYNVCIDWCGWAGTESLVDSVKELASRLGIDADTQLKDAMQPSQGVEAFIRIMSVDAPQVLVSNQELSLLLEHLNNSTSITGNREAPGDKVDTPKKLRKRPQLKSDYLAPRNKQEEAIAHIWEQLFGFETVGVSDDFFELGGDSLKAMTVSSKIHKELKVKIPVAAFFSSPTIEELAVYITGTGQKEIDRTAIPLAPEKEYYPLSGIQERLFHHYRRDPGSINYNVTLPFLLEGPVDRKKLEITFKKMIQRHETYRTSYHLVDNQPLQKIHPRVDFRLEYHRSSPEEAEEMVIGLKKPFDLNRAPIIRAVLIQLEAEKNILMIDTHHIAIDGTSFGIFQKEFMDLYGDRELPPLTVNHKDYCQWQQDRFRGSEWETMETYWLEQFKDPVSPLGLPTDFPGPEVPDYDGYSLWYNIDITKTRRLRELAQKTGTTTFMIFMAAYGILLHKYTGREDIVVGFRIACRPHNDLQKIIGRFSNELGFRSRPRPGLTFKEFLQQVKETALGLFKYQEYPFHRLQDQLKYHWNTHRGSLFDTMVVYNNITTETSDAPIENLKLSGYGFRRVKVLYDIFFQATEMGDIINLLIQYSTSLFKQETVERMIGDFFNILEDIIENPEIPLSQIELRPGEET
jgi:acyl transferase domain-containing protein/acyl carrier protein